MAASTGKITLSDEEMILRKRAEEILDLVKKTENEITASDNIIISDVYIEAGETDGMRLLAKAAGKLRAEYPGIHYHIFSGNAAFVQERLDKGLIDLGIVFGTPDLKKYEAFRLPDEDVWGVLMPKDAPLAEKSSIFPEYLWDKTAHHLPGRERWRQDRAMDETQPFLLKYHRRL